MTNILVVDDIKENIDVLKGLLKGEYKVTFAVNGPMAILNAERNQPDLILLDIMMPDMDGYEVCRRLKSNPVTRHIPIIFVSARDMDLDEAMGFDAGGSDYIIKPISPMIVRARIKTHLALSNQNAVLHQRVNETTHTLQETRLKIIKKLGRAAEFKDNETGLHIERMSRYCYILAVTYGFPENEADFLKTIAPMHDIGKIGISDSILKKEDKLSADEWEAMKEHPRIGADILQDDNSLLLSRAAEIALHHHERWDGSGYPEGLRGKDISIQSRITALTDVFDALTSRRPYKEAWSSEEAMAYIRAESGGHFDPEVVASFVRCYPDILAVQHEFHD